jgi:anti-sigma factor RsiW
VTGESGYQMTVPPTEGFHVQMLLGAYVLGALSPDEDLRVSVHLQSCDVCTADYLELAEVPSLLSALSEEDLLEGLGDHSPAKDDED